MHLVKEIEKGNHIQGRTMLLKLEIRHVHRYRLDNNWITLDCDGSYKSSTSIVGCGGLFTNSSENLVIDYAQKNGLCDALII